MGKLYFHRALMEPVICHLSTRSRFAYGTSPNQAPIDKIRIKTILNHFRDKPARARARVCVVDIPYMEGGDFAREGAIVNLSNKSKKALVEISLRNQNSAMILKRARKSAHFNLIPL
jgi:hypothetical protein